MGTIPRFPRRLSALPHLFSILLPAGQALRPCTTPVGGRLLHRVDRDAPGVLLLSHLFGLQNRCFSASGTTVPRRRLPFESARQMGGESARDVCFAGGLVPKQTAWANHSLEQ